MFFLFLRFVLGVVATLALFFPKAVVKVAEVADIPMVVVVVALGGSIGTSDSEKGTSKCEKLVTTTVLLPSSPFFI